MYEFKIATTTTPREYFLIFKQAIHVWKATHFCHLEQNKNQKTKQSQMSVKICKTKRS